MQMDAILPCLHQQKWLYIIVASDNIKIFPPKAKNCNQCSAAALKSAQNMNSLIVSKSLNVCIEEKKCLILMNRRLNLPPFLHGQFRKGNKLS